MTPVYRLGLDIISGESALPVRVVTQPDGLTWWETTAIMVGAFASLATLVEITIRLNGKK